MHSHVKGLNTAWAGAGVALVEQILRAARPEQVDRLLDLRAALKSGVDWGRVVDLFLACRREMELEQYLLFYRLRRLLGHWLELEFRGERDPEVRADLGRLLRWKFGSLDRLTARLERERFEWQLEPEDGEGCWVVAARGVGRPASVS